jgi:hypothetical protein
MGTLFRQPYKERPSHSSVKHSLYLITPSHKAFNINTSNSPTGVQSSEPAVEGQACFPPHAELSWAQLSKALSQRTVTRQLTFTSCTVTRETSKSSLSTFLGTKRITPRAASKLDLARFRPATGIFPASGMSFPLPSATSFALCASLLRSYGVSCHRTAYLDPANSVFPCHRAVSSPLPSGSVLSSAIG